MTRLLRALVVLCLCLPGFAHAEGWISTSRVGDEARFLFDQKILRYDLTGQRWLPEISLPFPGASAMAADSRGTVTAYGASIYAGATDFSGQTLLATTAGPIQSIVLDGNLVIAGHGTQSRVAITIFDRTTGKELSTREDWSVPVGYTVLAPATHRIFGQAQISNPQNTTGVSYTAAGILGAEIGNVSHGVVYDVVYPGKTWVLPGESRVADYTGAVYNAADLSYAGGLAGPVMDVATVGNDLLVLRRDGTLSLYDANLVEKLRGGIGNYGEGTLYATSDTAFVFGRAYYTDLPSVVTQTLSSLKVPTAGEAVNPQGLAYSIDQVLPTRDGQVLLFSRQQKSLFRWSPATKNFTGSIPLMGEPKYAAYSSESNLVYVAYADGNIRRLDLSLEKPVEVFFSRVLKGPKGLTLAGDLVVACDYSGNSDTQYIFAPDGTLTYRGYQDYSLNWQWDPATRRLYHLRDGITPNDLVYEIISPEGKVTGKGDSPYHEEVLVAQPLKLSPDASKIVTANGVVFETGRLTRIANLGDSYKDAVWDGDRLVTLSDSNGGAIVTTWQGRQFGQGNSVAQPGGNAVGLVRQGAGWLAITSVNGFPRFTLLDGVLGTTFVSPVPPLAPQDPAVTAQMDTSVTLSWQDASDNETGFRLDYRRAGAQAEWKSGGTAPANAGSAKVTGLLRETSYEFRVVAVAGTLESLPSASILATTSFGSSTTPGEPYHFEVAGILPKRVILQWENHTAGAAAFRIYRSTEWESNGPYRTVPAKSTTFQDTGLVPGKYYIYRIQAVFGKVPGDLSDPIQVDVPDGTIVPWMWASPSVEPLSATALRVTWTDGSLYEDKYIVERATNANGPWAKIATLPFNTTRYDDKRIKPGINYYYRITAVTTGGGSMASHVCYVPFVSPGGSFTGLTADWAEVAYFGFSTPDRIERYDLKANAWLPALPLRGAPTALTVDYSGIYVAEGRTISRYTLSGQNRTPVANGSEAVNTIFTLGDDLFYSENPRQLVTVAKDTGVRTSTVPFYTTPRNFTTAAIHRRAYFCDPYSPQLRYFDFDAQGVASGSRSGQRLEVAFKRIFVSPSEDIAITDNGMVFEADTLASLGSTGGSLSDLKFYDNATALVLRGKKLTAYSTATFKAGGNVSLAAEGVRVGIAGINASVFALDGLSSHGLKIQNVPLSRLGIKIPKTREMLAAVAPSPEISADEQVFDPTTGLSEQVVTITNRSSLDMDGFRIDVSGLPEGVVLYNGSGAGWIVSHLVLRAGESVKVTVQYLGVTEQASSPELALSGLAANEENGEAFKVRSIVRQTDSSVALDFTATPGESYAVEYSDDGLSWKACPLTIRAAGSVVRWVDRGEPCTAPAPATLFRRFYRVRALSGD